MVTMLTYYNNTLCVTALQNIKECLLQIKLTQILESQCAFSSKKPKNLQWDVRSQEANTMEFIKNNKLPELRCWGTAESWSRRLKSLSTYTENINYTVAYHKNLKLQVFEL